MKPRRDADDIVYRAERLLLTFRRSDRKGSYCSKKDPLANETLSRQQRTPVVPDAGDVHSSRESLSFRADRIFQISNQARNGIPRLNSNPCRHNLGKEGASAWIEKCDSHVP